MVILIEFFVIEFTYEEKKYMRRIMLEESVAFIQISAAAVESLLD